MSTPAQVGKNEWRNTISAAKMANCQARNIYRRMMREGSPIIQALVAQVMMEHLEIETALNRLDEIGRNTNRKGER